MNDRRHVFDRRRPQPLAPVRCPICKTTPPDLARLKVMVPMEGTQYVRQTGLRSDDEVRVCFECCGVVMCAVVTRRAA